MNRQALFDQFRLWSFPYQDYACPTEDRLAKALTLKENMIATGYDLRPEGVLFLAGLDNETLNDAWHDFQRFIPDIPSDPMYPDYPATVMEISEARLRLDQALHYASTYGMAHIDGWQKGWVPTSPKTEKTETDRALLKTKTVIPVKEEDVPGMALSLMLKRRRPLSKAEMAVFLDILETADKKELLSIIRETGVIYKGNLLPLCDLFLDSLDPRDPESIHFVTSALTSLCAHPGDLFRVAGHYLGKNHWKLSRTKRKLFCRAFCSWSPASFEENLYMSRKRFKQNERILKNLGFDVFARHSIHARILKAARNDQVKSWFSDIDEKIRKKDPSVLDDLAARPGLLLRQTQRLMKAGFDPRQVVKQLVSAADRLSAQTLVDLTDEFSTFDAVTGTRKHEPVFGMPDLAAVFLQVLATSMKSWDTPIKGKKVFIENGRIDPDNSGMHSSRVNGYVRPGLAYHIPKDVKSIRFFTYWNDAKKQADVDLHTWLVYDNGRTAHTGWNSDLRLKDEKGWISLHSGDMTSCDSAEYLDVMMRTDVLRYVQFVIDLYSLHNYADFRNSRRDFGNIETVLAGLQAVNEMGQDITLYDPKNCFLSCHLDKGHTQLFGILDLAKRCLRIEQKELSGPCTESKIMIPGFVLSDYIRLLAKAQNAIPVKNRKDADIVLSIEKSQDPDAICLIDSNFFLPN